MKIRNSVFTQKDINSDLLNTVLTIENKLYDLNEGEKLQQIMVFTTEDVPFSLAADTITQADFNQIAAFFKEINFLDDYYFENVMDQGDDVVEYFTNFIAPNKASDIAALMMRSAFGGFAFENFDFRNKESQEALDFNTNYGYFPEYEIADIEKRNQCIETICANLISTLKIDADTEMYIYLMTDALCDPSNSEFRIPFWVTSNAIIAFKSHVSV